MDLGKIPDKIDKIKNPMQYGAFVICAILIFISNWKGITPLVTVFVLAIIPPVILSTNLPGIASLTKIQQFYLIVLMLSVSFVFLVVSIIMIVFHRDDYAVFYEKEWASVYEPKLINLQNTFIEPNIENIKNISSKNEYFEFIINQIDEHSCSVEKCGIFNDDIEKLVNFFDRLLLCELEFRCSGLVVSATFNRPIHDFWYAYRPYIIKMRENGFGSNFGKYLEARAEVNYR